jgi:hypothetical protein
MLCLTKFENIIKYATGFITAPIAPLFLFSVKTNTKSVLLRYGKIDRIINPGLRWSPPGCTIYNVFTGTRIHSFKNLRLIDSIGTPIIISANIEYRIQDVGLYIINANGNNDVLINAANIILKQVCSSLPYISSNNTDKDLKKNNIIISNEISKLLFSFKSVDNYGFTIDSINIVEANYAPEIAQQMLIKQEALAYMEARKEIVNSAINVVKDVVNNLPELSKNTQEDIVSNLLTVLTSGNNIQQVLPLK